MNLLNGVRKLCHGFHIEGNEDFQNKVAPGLQLQVQLKWKLITVANLNL